jgi:hypothetical protein
MEMSRLQAETMKCLNQWADAFHWAMGPEDVKNLDEKRKEFRTRRARVFSPPKAGIQRRAV